MPSQIIEISLLPNVQVGPDDGICYKYDQGVQ